AQIFEHTAARPIGVGAIFENYIDKRKAVEGIAAHDLRVRHGEHLGGEGIRDLVLDDLRRLSGPFGVNDDLHIREVGDSVERDVPHREYAHQHQGRCGELNDELVPEGKLD